MRLHRILAFAVLACLALPSLARAEELLKPTKARSAMSKALKKLPASEREAEERRQSIEYLEKWNASGRKATSLDRYALAQFMESAGRLKDAAEAFAAVQADDGATEQARDYAANAEAHLLRLPELRSELSTAARMAAVSRLTKYAGTMAGQPARSKTLVKLLSALAIAQELEGDLAASLDLRLKVVKEDPKAVDDMLRPIVQGLLASAGAVGQLDALRAKAKSVLDTLRGVQQGELDAAKTKLDQAVAKLKEADPEALGPDGRLVKTDSREMSAEEKAVNSAQRAYDGASALFDAIGEKSQLFAALGKPAPAWTLEHAFGDVSDLASLKGKVVVLDFWATWPDLCNFPVMRDLMREYGSKGMTVVGVTTTAVVVYASRYDIDADMKDKDQGGRRSYAARLASESAPADPGSSIFEPEAYREHEQAAITKFIENHGLSWPCVMIAKDEPREKYMAAGWPHLVVLDKQGRIRLLQGGVVDRSETAAVASLRKLIATLLAE